MRTPLRNQIFFPVAGLLALAVLLFTAISAWHAVQVQQAQTAKHMEAVANALGSASYPLTSDVVTRIGAMIGGHVVVLDDRQRVTASTLPPSEPLRKQLIALPSATENASAPLGVAWESDSYLVTSIQRRYGGSPATLFVILRQDQFPVVWRNSIVAPLVVAAVILGLALLLAMLMSGRIAQRVEQVRSLFGRLAQGDFRAVAASGQDDEIRDLMESANVLSEHLRSMQQELLSAQRLQLLGQLSGGLAHQLKNSVAGARLAIQLHQRRCSADDPMIHTALAQLLLTEEQVRAVVTLEPQGQSANAEEPCDICQVMRDVMALLRPHCVHWKSAITLDAPERLRAVLKSPQSLKGGLLNLTQNAIEAAGVGGTIACRVECEEACIVIDIRDSGRGFAQDHRELMGAFQTTKPEGIGLGLTIAHHAVEQEQGTLTIARINDQTSVMIRIPWRPPESTQTAEADTIAASPPKAAAP